MEPDFLEQLRSSNQPQKFIYLSDYDDLDYAQKAIGRTTYDYLLKSVDQEKIVCFIEAKG
ncbi:hypothetical protein [Paenibacillus sp. KS-LC4]|uniref:hypothetical protein n=1 Tax=Paenibacillus sp. KS-LC4 TaxID=2979727 RepID=UPI0030CD050E